MKHALKLLIHAVAAVVLGTACQPDLQCDVGYVYNDGQCLRAAAPPPPQKQDAGADDGGGAGDVSAADAKNITFGTPCMDAVNHSDCQSATTTVCLMYPGDTTGQCSAIGCNTGASTCPTGWSCFDLSLFQPGAPHGCVPF